MLFPMIVFSGVCLGMVLVGLRGSSTHKKPSHRAFRKQKAVA
jgi:hypothetical protein